MDNSMCGNIVSKDSNYNALLRARAAAKRRELEAMPNAQQQATTAFDWIAAAAAGE